MNLFKCSEDCLKGIGENRVPGTKMGGEGRHRGFAWHWALFSLLRCEVIHRCVKLASALLSLVEPERKNKNTAKNAECRPTKKDIIQCVKQQEKALRSFGYTFAGVGTGENMLHILSKTQFHLAM